MISVEFTFSGLAAGVFESAEAPKKVGRYTYEPLRSGGHFKMGEAIEKNGFAEIEFVDGGSKRSAKVFRPDYGVLEVIALT